MPFRVEVGFKEGIRDAQGEKIAKKIRNFLGIDVKGVKTIFVYTIDADLTEEEVERIASGPFSDPIIQRFSINEPLEGDFDFSIEVGFRPGVTDNVGRTAKEAIECLLGKRLKEEEKVYTSILYLIKGDLNEKDAERIAKDLLANTLINRYYIISRKDWDGKVSIHLPKVKSIREPQVLKIDLNIPDDELLKLSKDRF